VPALCPGSVASPDAGQIARSISTELGIDPCALVLCRRQEQTPQAALLRCSVSLVTLCLATLGHAETYYVSPDGGGSACTRDEPCALNTGADSALAGETVILMDGVYTTPLLPENSGSPEAWITFQADECALPIIEGPGEAMVEDEDGDLPSGVACAQPVAHAAPSLLRASPSRSAPRDR